MYYNNIIPVLDTEAGFSIIPRPLPAFLVRSEKKSHALKRSGNLGKRPTVIIELKLLLLYQVVHAYKGNGMEWGRPPNALLPCKLIPHVCIKVTCMVKLTTRTEYMYVRIHFTAIHTRTCVCSYGSVQRVERNNPKLELSRANSPCTASVCILHLRIYTKV
jgi:hypothetical protein